MATNKRKRGLALLLMMAVLLFTLTACGGKPTSGETTAQTEAASQASSAETKAASQQGQTASEAQQAATTADAQQSADKPASGGTKTLVVYFSATGTTKGVAEQIASVSGADTYEITAAQTYTEADLNWNDTNSRTTLEQNDKSVRPAIGSETISLDAYSTIFIGYPIWWGEEPRIMDTFVESYDFTGKTMIPFCTSGGSGIGASGSNLAANAKTGTWLEGTRLSGSSDIKGWIDGLGVAG
ncbi:flavodoxin [Ruminococcus sp.]|uniref:flavodoxin n=1 Tax=Ruminococcus sp. TaxID=41978 RepID=UPI00388FCDBF